MNDLNLMDIAREANKRGDADTLRCAPPERLLPIVSADRDLHEFCTELDNANNKLASKRYFGGDDSVA